MPVHEPLILKAVVDPAGVAIAGSVHGGAFPGGKVIASSYPVEVAVTRRGSVLLVIAEYPLFGFSTDPVPE